MSCAEKNHAATFIHLEARCYLRASLLETKNDCRPNVSHMYPLDPTWMYLTSSSNWLSSIRLASPCLELGILGMDNSTVPRDHQGRWTFMQPSVIMTIDKSLLFSTNWYGRAIQGEENKNNEHPYKSIVGYGLQALDLEKLCLHTNSGVSSSILW